MLGWGERSRALQTLFLLKDGESCFPKTTTDSVHATTIPNLSPFHCPSYAKHTIFYFLYFSQSKKFKNLILTNISACVRLLISANE